MRTQEANAGLSTMTSDEDRAQGSRVMTAEFLISVLRSLVAGEAGAPRAEGAWLGFAGEYAGGAGEAEAGGGKEGGTNRGGEEAACSGYSRAGSGYSGRAGSGEVDAACSCSRACLSEQGQHPRRTRRSSRAVSPDEPQLMCCRESRIPRAG